MTKNQTNLRSRIHEVIFEAETKWGKRFDIALFVAIGISVAIVAFESVPSINEMYGET